MIERLRQFILSRRNAYRAVFGSNERTRAQVDVLADLRRFCRATVAPAVYSPISGVIDDKATYIAIGRQEVWHRICQHIHLSDADLYRLVESSDAQKE